MKNLYYKKDRDRGLYKTYLWLIEEIGELSESIRKFELLNDLEKKVSGNKQEIEEEMADIIAWISSLANLYDINLEKACLDKYSSKCPKCGKNPCACKNN